jgi:hypothetical protein
MEEQYITNTNGTKYHYKDEAKTILHRLDGPAIESANGTREWFVNGKRHRLDGPAVEYADGYKFWYVNGVFIVKVNKKDTVIDRME